MQTVAQHFTRFIRGISENIGMMRLLALTLLGVVPLSAHASSFPVIDFIALFLENLFTLRVIASVAVAFLIWDAFRIKWGKSDWGDMGKTLFLAVIAGSAVGLIRWAMGLPLV
jgi:hypothetical protein